MKDFNKKLVENVNGVPMVSSRQVAEMFGKHHKIVIRDIKVIIKSLKSQGTDLCGDNFADENFISTTYLTPRGKHYGHYLLTQDAFTLVAMGYSGRKALAMKLEYINQFNSMKATLNDKGGLTNEKAQSFLDQMNELLSYESDRADIATKWAFMGITLNEGKKDHNKKFQLLVDEIQICLPLGDEVKTPNTHPLKLV